MYSTDGKVTRKIRIERRLARIMEAYGKERHGSLGTFAVAAMKAEIRRHSKNRQWVALMEASESEALAELAEELRCSGN